MLFVFEHYTVFRQYGCMMFPANSASHFPTCLWLCRIYGLYETSSQVCLEALPSYISIRYVAPYHLWLTCSISTLLLASHTLQQEIFLVDTMVLAFMRKGRDILLDFQL